MFTGRRVTVLLIALTLLGLPAVILRLVCFGASCEGTSVASADVPFCPLPPGVREPIGDGFREGSSPDVLGVTPAGGTVNAPSGGLLASWPSAETTDDGRVPIAFAGEGVRGGALPGGTGLDQIAPTLEYAAGFRRAHPEVRSGQAIPDVIGGSDAPAPLILLVAWKGVGSRDLGAAAGDWPFLRSLLREGSGTLDGQVGSLPVDPVASLATLGTGGLPSEHGVVGSKVRSPDGAVVDAWGPEAPLSVIAAFGDDLTHRFGDRSRVAGVLTVPGDRGIIGGGWWQEPEQDDVTVGADPVGTTRALLDAGYGHDPATDLIGVVLDGPIREMDAATRQVIDLVRERVPGTVVVVAGTGASSGTGGVGVRSVIRQVNDAVGAPIVAEGSSSGLFLDRKVLADRGLNAQAVVDALRGATGPDGNPLVADAFPSFSVAFARYCP